MRTLGIDLETFSEVDIKKAGLYHYAENSEILLFAYAWDDDPVQVVDVAQGEELLGVLQRADADQVPGDVLAGPAGHDGDDPLVGLAAGGQLRHHLGDVHAGGQPEGGSQHPCPSAERQ